MLLKNAGLEDKVTWISFNSDYLKTMASEFCLKQGSGYLSKKDVSKNTIETLKRFADRSQNEVFLDIKIK